MEKSNGQRLPELFLFRELLRNTTLDKQKLYMYFAGKEG